MSTIKIQETIVCAPSELPFERPIGPTRKYCTRSIAQKGVQSMTLEEQAAEVMSRIEGELISKYHLDHVVGKHGRSPYRVRADGFKLKITECNNSNSNAEDAAAFLRCYKLIAQNVGHYQKLVGDGPKGASRIADELMANVDVALVRDSQTCYNDILTWYKHVSENGHDDGSALAIHEKYKSLAEGESNRMARERAENYRQFMQRAISHKSS